ncbi:YraN family protein [bacterium]|nr:YraN family protein [bacterium]
MDLGRAGETIAVKYLKNKGYTIIARNYRGDRCEIDIIARTDNIIVFAEVKASRSQFEPESQVTDIKKVHIIRAAHSFLSENEILDLDCRFDLIALRRQMGEWIINHIQDAFRPE